VARKFVSRSIEEESKNGVCRRLTSEDEVVHETIALKCAFQEIAKLWPGQWLVGSNMLKGEPIKVRIGQSCK
jgi:hypothetical protein